MAGAISAAVSPFRIPLVLVSELPLPPLISVGVKALHYCTHVQRELLRWDARSQSPFLYLGGVLVRSQCDHLPFLRAVAKVVLVARESLRVVESGEEVVRCVEAFYEALKIPSKMALRYRMQRIRLKRRFSNHWSSCLPWQLFVIAERASLVARRALSLLLACWCLHVSMACLSEAITSDGPAAIDDLFVNIEAIATAVASEEEKMSELVRRNIRWVDRSLQLMGIPLSARDIIRTLDQFSSQTRGVVEFVSGFFRMRP